MLRSILLYFLIDNGESITSKAPMRCMVFKNQKLAILDKMVTGICFAKKNKMDLISITLSILICLF